MDENLHNIEDLFRDGLENNVEMPPLQAWKDIDNILNRDNVVSIKKKYTAMKRLAVLLLLLLLGFSIYELTNRHNAEGIVKDNGNGSNTESISKRSDKETGLSHIIPSQKIVDSINLNIKNKENIPNDNSVDNKNTATNIIQIQPGTINVIENKSSSSNTTNYLTEKDSYNKNISINNTVDNNNTVEDNIFSSKNKRKLRAKGGYKVRINSPKPSEYEQQSIVNTYANENNQQLNQLKRLSPVAIDKINRLKKDSIDSKKLLQSLAVIKIIPPDDTKNTVATNTKRKGSNKPSRLSFTPFFSPDIAWYRLQEDKPDNQPDNLAAIEKSEKHEFSSTVGALVDYKLNRHWSLQSGLTYSNTNITVQPKTIYAQSDNIGSVKYRINTSSGYGYVLPSFSSTPAIGDSLYAFTSTHTINYIGIPLAIKYNITKGKFSFNMMAGFSTNILIRGKIETTVAKGFNNETEVVNNLQGLRKIYFSGLAGLGIDYKLNKKISLSFAPTYRFALNSINQDAPVKSYPNSLGLLIGLKIGL